ncbi:MAG: hypothetical protein KAR20_16405, partial [Candidatus Heimdallarchaeota archaeon]|nr:hypothetical protein [Candidatus Heimdallarchaeota archaeon]
MKSMKLIIGCGMKRHNSIRFIYWLLTIGVVITLFVNTGYALNATNQSNEISQTPIIVEIKSPYNNASSDLKNMWPAVIGSVLTLVGVLVAAFFTSRRESA